MLKQILKQPSASGISATAVATLNIPTTGIHHALFLRPLTSAGAGLTRTEILADIGNIIVRVNGNIVRDVSADFLLDMQKYYGDAKLAGNVDGVIPIYFDAPLLPTEQERELFALGMYGVDSFTVDITCDAVAQLSSIEAYSLVSANPLKLGLGQHIVVNKYPQTFATTGDQEVIGLPKEGETRGYRALHITEGSGQIDKVSVKVGGREIVDQVPTQLNQAILEKSGRVPQNGYFHVDFAVSDDLSSFLPMAGIQDFRQTINWNTAEGAPSNFNIYTERLFGLRSAK